MKKTITWAILGMLMAPVAANSAHLTPIQKHLTETSISTTATATFQLEGFKMSCCTGIVVYALKELPGFISAEADVSKQQITIEYNPEKTTKDELINKLNETPYKVVQEII